MKAAKGGKVGFRGSRGSKSLNVRQEPARRPLVRRRRRRKEEEESQAVVNGPQEEVACHRGKRGGRERRLPKKVACK